MELLAHFHPEVVHFPIALLLAYVLCEIMGIVFRNDFFSKTAHLLLLLGVLGLIAAVLTGNQAKDVARLWKNSGANIPMKEIGEHEDYANATLWYFAFLLVVRTMLVLKKKFVGYLKYSFIVLSLVGAFLVYETGVHGGDLVYKYGVGTNLKKMEIQK